MRALLAGSFDPVTIGHLDLISRFVPLVDSLVIAVAVNIEKRPLFDDTERVEMLRDACRPWPTVEVVTFTGLIVEAARHFNADVIARGVRSSGEFEREVTMARVNRALTGIETLLLPASPDLSFVSSSLVKELASFGGDVAAFVPTAVAVRLRAKFHHTP
ncbi:MAG TPA: pantetheine-phosphate adenylyltransferase [Armatimonadota bacterium]|jgi:pantetheine-phosphate adenylyltransferase